MADIFDFPRDARNVARADGKGADMGGEAPQTMLMRPQGVPDQVWNAVLSRGLYAAFERHDIP